MVNKVNHKNNTNEQIEQWFCTEILKLRALHYGYWAYPQGNNRIDLDGVRTAQMDYTETLLAMIPAGVSKILQVGDCVGDIPYTLNDEGYKVTALSPSVYQRAVVESSIEKGIIFYDQNFEDFYSASKFDLVLMTKPQGDFGVIKTLLQAQKTLRPGGYLLVSGNFRQEKAALFEVYPFYSTYRSFAEQIGFEVITEMDITENILPTLDYANAAFRETLLPALSKVDHLLGSKNSLKSSLKKLAMQDEIRLLKDLKNYYSERLNPDLYRANAFYKRVLFIKRG